MMYSAGLFALSVVSRINAVYAAACTPAQLAAPDNRVFRITGGGGSYAPGTNQIVSWDWPTGSAVTQISNLRICQGATCQNAASVSGVPVNFIASQPDRSGAIPVTLPNSLAAGAYVFRLNLLTSVGTTTCWVDQAFTVIPGNIVNECNIGDSRCVGTTGRQVCINGANGRVYGPTQQCSVPQTCTQAGNVATCSLGTPSSCSTFGKYQCFGDSYRVCQYNAASQLVYSEPFSCGSGNTCQQNGNSFFCVSKSTNNQCQIGERQCASSAQFRECTFNSNGNIFGPAQNCPPGTSCTGAGFCTSGTPGSCTSGFMKCASSTTFQQCVNGAFGPAQSCGAGTTCKVFATNYIICS